MSDRLFFDSNIICYAYDRSSPEKRKVCESLVADVFDGKVAGVVSNQVLGETFNALVMKLGVGIDEARIIVEALIVSDRWEKVNYTEATIKSALRDFAKSKGSFWDLVIAETLRENGVSGIVTENVKDFKKFEGLKVVSPF